MCSCPRQIEQRLQHETESEAKIKLEELFITFKSILQEAASCGHLCIVKYFVKRNFNVNIIDINYDSPLHDAIRNNHADVVAYLIKNGANIFQMNISEMYPLDYLDERDVWPLISFFYKCNAQIWYNVKHNGRESLSQLRNFFFILL